MEEVFIEPGYYYIAQKILQNLDDDSIMTLSKTNKHFLKVCYHFLTENPESISYVEDKTLDPCHIIRDFFTFAKQNNIHHEIFFKYPWKTRNLPPKILLKVFIQKLTDLCIYNEMHFSWRLSRIIEKFIRFIPSSCPPTSMMNLMKLLEYVLRKPRPDLQLVKILLAATKDFGTCVRKVIYILKTYDGPRPLNQKNAIKIAVHFCKNPNMPNEFGNTAIHMASEFNYLDIIVDLIPYCNNLDIVNDKGYNCLASVVEKLYFVKEHAEIVKMIVVMSEKQKGSNIYETMPTHLVAKSIFFEIFDIVLPSKECINFLMRTIFWLGFPFILFLSWLFWKAQKILSKMID